MACNCGDETDVTQTVYRDPRTDRDHIQYICTECGDIVKNPDNGRMV